MAVCIGYKTFDLPSSTRTPDFTFAETSHPSVANGGNHLTVHF
jgi:hypothetical protein